MVSISKGWPRFLSGAPPHEGSLSASSPARAREAALLQQRNAYEAVMRGIGRAAPLPQEGLELTPEQAETMRVAAIRLEEEAARWPVPWPPNMLRLQAANADVVVAASECFKAHQTFVTMARSEDAKLRNARRVTNTCGVCNKPLGRLARIFSDSVCGRCSQGGIR
jgi:hypothetical protein